MWPPLITFILAAPATALALRWLGLFSPIRALAMSAAIAVFFARRRTTCNGARPPWTRLVILPIAFFYAMNPSEYLLGNWDPGVYLAQGFAAASHAGWTLPDTAACALSDEARFELYPFHQGDSVKAPGFFAPLKKPGVLIPQFFPLYPSLLALTSRLGGIRLALLTDTLLILASALLLADMAERLFRSPIAGDIVLGWFCLHPVVVWFARFHTAESLLLLLWVTFLWAVVRMSTDSDWRNLAIECLCAVLLPWTSPAAFPLSAAMILQAFYPTRARAQQVALAVASLTGLLGVSVFLWQTKHPYGRHLLGLLPTLSALRPVCFSRAPWLLLLLFGSVAAGGAARAYMGRSGAGQSRTTIAAASTVRLEWAFMAVTVFLSGLSFILMPRMPPFASGLLALLPLPFWFWAGWGLRTNFTSHPRARPWLSGVVITVLIVSMGFVLWPAMPLMYPWAWKRWIWILFPVIVLFAGLGCSAAARLCSRRVVFLSAVFLLMLTLPAHYHYSLAKGGEWRGLTPWMSDLSKRIPPNSIIITPKELATPLELIFGHTVVPLYLGENVRRDSFYVQVWKSASPAKPVVVIAESPPPWLPSEARRTIRIPDYRGDWIKPNRSPAYFQRQPRGFSVFIWMSDASYRYSLHTDGSEQAAPTR